jgi:hypothetical protein
VEGKAGRSEGRRREKWKEGQIGVEGGEGTVRGRGR